MLGVLIIVIGVGVSIALHEIGHLVPAKRFGVKVTQYMVGFGPTIWSRRKGETEYGIKAVPLGGYIRMIGMLPPRPGDAPGELRTASTGRFSQLIDQARADSMEQVKPGDEDRVFYKLSPAKKIIVMFGGPFMNFLLAVLLIGATLTLVGASEPRPGAFVVSVSECVVKADDPRAREQVCGDAPKTPAFTAGLKQWDKIVSINGLTISGPEDVPKAVRPRAGQPTEVVVERDGVRMAKTLTPVENVVPELDDDGEPVVGADGQGKYTKAGFLGVSTAENSAFVRQPVSAVPGAVWETTRQTAGIILNLPARMAGVADAAFGGGERDPNGPVGVVGVGRIGGEIAELDIPEVMGGDRAKLAMFLGMVGSLNLALFVFNLIPLLPLDGGHIAGALWEALKKGWARIRRRPDPGYVDVARALPLTYAVAVLLIGMSALLLYADIVNPIKLFG